ncbi:MAG TPA: 5-oxoprolinase subunit PxpA [Alcaligenes sp.]|nr:5-oxoprolinase subunit PxpA [Alcaligenes sp.]HRL27460.1 5-oxoprolinase subunit PxpA [Alcaligenes sp.]
MSLQIDLNCDMGESFGAWTMGHDQQVMPWVSSVNIACGFHAGDPATMRRTVALALEHGVRIGAHPGLPDLVGFGRRVMAISPQEAYDLVVVQVGALAAVARSQGAALHHVKAHGALYNMAARDAGLAQAIAQAVADVDGSLVLYALAGSVQAQIGRQAGLAVAQEVFADRSYQPDGSLTPRQQPGAMITDVQQSVDQVLQMVEQGRVTCLTGESIALQADTLCLHGDQPGAADFARHLHAAFQERGIRVQAV